MIKLSVVIITFNEEKNIRRCIESVLDVADEILVVDSFSKDTTKTICSEYEVRFIEHAFDGHIEQKNWAMQKAEYDYVLSLDADEALSDKLKKSILKAKKNWTDRGFAFNRLTNYCGKWIRHCGWYPDTKTRMVYRKNSQWGGTNPHDKLLVDHEQEPVHLKGDLLHYSFYTIDQHMDTIKKFSTIAAKEKFQKGQNAGFLKLWLAPAFKFFKCYFLKAGFLDGFYGLVVCANSAHASFLRYAKLRALNRGEKIE